jgi:hypothetical protein
MSKLENERAPPRSKSERVFSFELEVGTRCGLALEHRGLVGVQLGHFLHVCTLTVEKHEVHGFDGGGHGGHEVTGDGLQNQLGRCLLREPVPVGENTAVSDQDNLTPVGGPSTLAEQLGLRLGF